jgi:hypothetical protein
MRYLLILSLLVSGCATATIETTTVEGKLCRATYVSVFKDTDASSMSACGGKGSATGSRSNTDLLEALLPLLSVPK